MSPVQREEDWLLKKSLDSGLQTGSDSSTYAPEATPRTRTKEDPQSQNFLDLVLPARFQSCESTIVDDSIFEQFIQSPSPIGMTTTLTSDRVRQAVIDIDDLVSPSHTNFSETNLSHHDSDPNHSLDTPVETRPKLHIRLRVEPPKTRIKLRVSSRKESDSTKGLRPPKKCKGNTRQRSQKKTTRRKG